MESGKEILSQSKTVYRGCENYTDEVWQSLATPGLEIEGGLPFFSLIQRTYFCAQARFAWIASH